MSEPEPEAWTFSVGDEPVEDPVALREAEAARAAEEAAAAAAAATAAAATEPADDPTGVWAPKQGVDEQTWETGGLEDPDVSWETAPSASGGAWGEDDDMPAWGSAGAGAATDAWGSADDSPAAPAVAAAAPPPDEPAEEPEDDDTVWSMPTASDDDAAAVLGEPEPTPAAAPAAPAAGGAQPADEQPAAEDVLESLLAEAEAEAEDEPRLPPVLEIDDGPSALDELVAAAEQAVAAPTTPAAVAPVTPAIEGTGDEAVWSFSVDGGDGDDDDETTTLAEAATPRPDRGWYDAEAAAESAWPDVTAPPSRYREGGEPDAFVALTEATDDAAADDAAADVAAADDVSSYDEVEPFRMSWGTEPAAASDDEPAQASPASPAAAAGPASFLDEILDASPGASDELDPIPLPSAAQPPAAAPPAPADDLGLDELGLDDLGLDDLGLDDLGGPGDADEGSSETVDEWAGFSEAADDLAVPAPDLASSDDADDEPVTPAVVDLQNFSAGGKGRAKDRKGRRKR